MERFKVGSSARTYRRARTFGQTFPCLLAALAALAVPAQANVPAATLSIAPIRITISKAGRAQTATVINGGGAPIDVAVDAYGWAQRAGFPLDLSESKNLLVYPRLLHIGAHAEGIVKVGVVDPLAPSERSYRLAFTQVPDANDDLSTAPHAINFRMRITMPVFVAPSEGAAAAGLLIEKAAVEAQAIRIWVRNAGARHTVITGIDVDATDARGMRVSQTHTAGWYVLAGAEQTFSAPSDGEHCARIVRLSVNVHTEDGGTIAKVFAPASTCAR